MNLYILLNIKFDPHLSERCSKGPSFFPTPSSDNWYALLEDFDNFKHKKRCKVYFYKTSNKTELTNDGIPPIIKSQSNKVAPKYKKNVFIKNITRYIQQHFIKEK